MNVGIIGFGLMGSQIAARLIETDHYVMLDRTKTKPFERNTKIAKAFEKANTSLRKYPDRYFILEILMMVHRMLLNCL
jgi:3-hydroxyisobutyrate dehydrogenase-like beta-hydroxyacid dehydrogenase